MRKVILLLFALVVIVAACSKTKQLTNIEVDIPFTETLDASKIPDSTHYPSLPLGGIPVDFPTIPFNPNSQQYLSQNNTAINKINSVTLGSMVLQMTAPAGRHLDFLHSVSIYIASDTLPQIRVAHKINIPKGSSTVALDDTSADLKKYFLQNTIYLHVSAVFDSIPPRGTSINVITTFHLSANPLN